MFVLTKETSVDGYHTAFDKLIVCSKSYESLEALELLLHKEKEELMYILNNYKTGVNMKIRQSELLKHETLSKFFKNYWEIDLDNFNFEISRVEEIK